MDVAVLMPVKDFRQAKARLADAVDPAGRESLARWMAERVLAAAGAPVFVVCDSDDVASWARARDATVLWTPDIGLNAAVAAGAVAVAEAGFDQIAVAHSDLPLADRESAPIAALAHAGEVTLVPDTRSDGTNVLVLPTSVAVGESAFRFRYGPGSFRAHLAETERLGLVAHVERHPRLALDVDTIEDLHHPLIARLIDEEFPTWTPPTNPVSPR